VRVSVLISILLFVSGTAVAADNGEYPLGQRSIFSDRAVEERIRPVGTVCLEGEECGTTMAAADTGGQQAASGPRGGQAIYDQYCATCHKTGAAGAPKLGDTAAWKSRIGKGMDTLLKHAWEGFKGMPAKGMCSDCSKEEMKAAVQYMVDNSK
jgi:cytochrome c5